MRLNIGVFGFGVSYEEQEAKEKYNQAKQWVITKKNQIIPVLNEVKPLLVHGAVVTKVVSKEIAADGLELFINVAQAGLYKLADVHKELVKQ